MDIRITCRAADALPIDALLEFQGNLKHITKENLDKLKRSILKHGFSAPIFVWKGVDNRILDGHQRLKALLELRQEGYTIPMLPVAYIEADDEKHAREKLLYITSQYGEFDFMEIGEWLDEIDGNEFAFATDIITWQKETKTIKEITLQPYTKVHVLISIDINDYIKIRNHIVAIENLGIADVKQTQN